MPPWIGEVCVHVMCIACEGMQEFNAHKFTN